MPARTKHGMVVDMSEAAVTKSTVCDLKGPSPLLNVPGFDLVCNFNPDYMHCALLGVTRQLTELWFSIVGEDFYIGDPSRQSIVTERSFQMKPAQCINRPPRAGIRRWPKGNTGFFIIVCFAKRMYCHDSTTSTLSCLSLLCTC